MSQAPEDLGLPCPALPCPALPWDSLTRPCLFPPRGAGVFAGPIYVCPGVVRPEALSAGWPA